MVEQDIAGRAATRGQPGIDQSEMILHIRQATVWGGKSPVLAGNTSCYSLENK